MIWRRSLRRCQQIVTLRCARAIAAPRSLTNPTLPPPTSRLFAAVRSGRGPEWSALPRGAWGAGGTRGLSNQAELPHTPGSVVDVPLAQTGEGIAECELLSWSVEEGDSVEEFQKLCEVQSDKATIEITSRYSGKIQQILFAPGEIVKVGESLLRILVEESTTHQISDDDDSEIIVEENTTSMNDDSAKCHVTQPLIERGVLSTPFVRHLAKQQGVEISNVHGTGKGGRILKEDILKYVEGKGISKGSPSHVDLENFCSEDKTVPLRGFYRSMVNSMTMAAKVPHFHYVEEINCDALVQLKVAFQKGNSDPHIKHTYLPFLIKALSMALHKYPMLNSTFKEDSTEVIFKGSHNVGIAMATPNGLVVPNIKKVHTLSVLEITKELSRLQLLALDNKLSTADISGGTITLSNIGAIGGKFGCPLINLPEVAIIAIGRIQKLPRYADNGKIYPASIANVAVGADHRVVDGATVARFCTEWKLLIEKPELLLLHMK